MGIPTDLQQGAAVVVATPSAVASLQDAAPSENASSLSLWDAISIIIGIVVGAGIYETSPFILKNLGSPGAALIFWSLGGGLSLIGALCYAELATAYPRSGGDYVYLTHAYGRLVGFLFGWAELSCIMTGSIGMMAYIFAQYAGRLWSVAAEHQYLFAGGTVLALTAVNLLGVSFGKGTQNILTLAKILGIGAKLVGASTAPAQHNYPLAMILILYTYGGWNDAAYVAAEQRNHRRNIPLALILGTVLITVIYLLINMAYLLVLGFDDAANAREIAADVLMRLAGVQGEKLMCVLVLISSLGAANGLILTGSRIYSTLGRDHRLFALLSVWHPRWRAPVRSLCAQCAVTLLMVLAVGTNKGHDAIDRLLSMAGQSPPDWSGRSGFQTLLDCTAPMFWMFFLLTAISLLVLRWKEPGCDRPFRVPGYPLIPGIFCAACAYMLYSAAVYAGWLTLLGMAPVILGLPLYWLSEMMGRRTV
jgi:basic amino acid/polyamine antiporter, APA family